MTRFLKSGPSFAEARWVLFGAPCDTTVSRKGGTRYAPDAVRSESHHIESYSPYLSEDLEKVSFFDMGDLFFCPWGRARFTVEDRKDVVFTCK